MESLRITGHNGVQLAADAMGPRDATPVILVPGGGQTRRAWQRTVHRLAHAGYRVIAIDLRGHGESDWSPDGDYSLDAFVGDVVSTVRAMSKPPILVGASLGGLSAAVAAGEHPTLPLRGLALVDIVPHVRADGIEKIRSFMAAGQAGFESPEQAAASVTAYMPHRPPRTARSLSANLRQRNDGRWYWHWDPVFSGTGRQQRGNDFSVRMAAALPAIRVPTLLVSGLRSELVDEIGIRRFRELMPAAEWIGVHNAAHMVAGDANTQFSAALIDFIARLSENRTALSASNLLSQHKDGSQ
jgi:pimeloyl-ACP methyl ester carboxylesterase